MILADTSVWIDHFRHGDERMATLLNRGQILMHPFVLGELALGNLTRRDAIIAELNELPQMTVAEDYEVMEFITQENLFGCGIGFVDAHLLTSVRLTPGTRISTRDKRLAAASTRLGVAYG